MNIMNSLIDDLGKAGAKASFDQKNRSLDIETCNFRPLPVTLSLAIDEHQLRTVIAHHQNQENASKAEAYNFLLSELLLSLTMYGSMPGPYVLDEQGRVARGW